MSVKLSPDLERELAESIGRFYNDPYGWVMFSYPWGQPTLPDGSPNPLAKKKGPEAWQKKLLKALGKHIRDNTLYEYWGLFRLVWRSAVASGHGVGKSALVAWIIQFLMSTRRDTRIVATANTASQLETKTWPELAKWHKLLINRHWFEWTSTSYYFKQYPEDQRKNYMANAVTVSEDNTEAFAGLHNEAGTVAIIFDEASGIFAKLWEVAMGAVTDGEGFFFAFGNPTQPEGEFADCFDKHRGMYYTGHVDSRDVTHTNKAALQDIIRRYGEDSDEVKVRIKGIFPAQAYNGFIGRDTLDLALQRELIHDPGAPIIMAIDGARYGPDKNVIRCRQGRNGRIPPLVIPGKVSNTQLARIIAIEADKIRPDAIVMESVGPTVGTIDILRDRGYKVIEVHPGAPSADKMIYDRVRDEIWHKMRDWIVDEGCIDEEPALIEQLSKIQYFVDTRSQKTKIERKEDYCERTRLSSPDEADSLALTFAVNIARRDRNLDAHRKGQNGGDLALSEYDMFNH